MDGESGNLEFGPNWPSDRPIGVVVAMVIAILSTGAFIGFQYKRDLPFVERLYLKTYLTAAVLRVVSQTGDYTLPIIIDRKLGPRFAGIGEVLATSSPNGLPGLALTELAEKDGAVRIEWHELRLDNDYLYEMLRHGVFQGQSWWDVLQPACYKGMWVLLLGLCVGIARDMRATAIRRRGRLVRGPLVVTRDEFNRKRNERGGTDGIGFAVEEPLSLGEKLFATFSGAPMLRIPRKDETRHLLLMGTRESGKTIAIKQVMIQARDAGHTAIIYDPTLEYIRRLYDPRRGDLILNPLDGRAPYWNPGDEVQHDAEALTIANALFPDQPRKTSVYLHRVRKLFAHLLRFHPTPDQLVQCMSNPSEIDKWIVGTPYAATIRQIAPRERESVLSTMNNVADILRCLKTKKDFERRWTAREWVKGRQGWIFLTSTPETREALKPLHNLWLDLLILRLLNQPDDHATRRVWLVLDEVALLQHLSQLETALTQIRKAETSIVLGLEDKAQLETIYGHIGEKLLTMPATVLVFKTKERAATEWAGQYLGVQEIERWRPSKVGPKMDVVERISRHVVNASAIRGLPERKGYLKSGNFIVPLTVARQDLPIIAEGFIPRKCASMFPARPEPSKARRSDEPARPKDQTHPPGQGRTYFE